MRSVKVTFFTIFFSFTVSSCAAISLGKSEIKVQIVDENQTPVTEVDVSFSFRNYPQDDKFMTKTDQDGYAHVKKYGDQRVSINADKEGYYYSQKVIEFDGKQKDTNYQNKIYKIILKKIRKPVPMFAQRISTKIPTYDSPVGYDLQVGDWVAPYGKGIEKDYIFNFHCEHESIAVFECSYTLNFSNKHDGIQTYIPDNNNSIYKWPFTAPQTGYLSSLTGTRSRKHSGASYASEQEHMKYIFRVRTKIDKNGNIIDARYGKMDGDIEFYPTKIMFAYYFNPDGTSNLEFDPKQNLFTFTSDDWRFRHKVTGP